MINFLTLSLPWLITGGAIGHLFYKSRKHSHVIELVVNRFNSLCDIVIMINTNQASLHEDMEEHKHALDKLNRT
jgi:hypothetical protein